MEMISNCPCFLLQLTLLECFMFHVSKMSMVVQIHITHITHPSNQVSCSRLEAWDRVFQIFFERARTSLVVRGSAFFHFSFFVSNFNFSLAGFSLFVIGDGIRSCALRKNARKNVVHSSLRPTVPWLKKTLLYKLYHTMS